ncbi:M50 family metallopeptidase [Neobacillus terrae]|uniref:M50 family metallopeptidase n=1 Tax=Neobacillus terrae TaxID=3034837 RepID=UPI00140D280C|nr:M50 family metallopeptidase [Neobacillus terrae]NHM31210.1 M50 family metallopeptidase [Neobacillus terrae]
MRAIFNKLSGKSFLFLLLAFVLIQVPVLGNYVSMIDTLIHESGHAIISLLGGKVDQISLFSNTEGVTVSSQSTWIGAFFTSLAGYFTSSLLAFIAFWLIGKRKYKIMILILLTFIVLNIIFWVRNLYGLFWLISFGVIFLFLLAKGSKRFNYHLVLLFASIIMVDSVKSGFDVMYISFLTPIYSGDAANLAHLTEFIPAQVWGIYFFLQSLWFCFFGLKKGIFKLANPDYSKD